MNEEIKDVKIELKQGEMKITEIPIKVDENMEPNEIWFMQDGKKVASIENLTIERSLKFTVKERIKQFLRRLFRRGN